MIENFNEVLMSLYIVILGLYLTYTLTTIGNKNSLSSWFNNIKFEGANNKDISFPFSLLFRDEENKSRSFLAYILFVTFLILNVLYLFYAYELLIKGNGGLLHYLLHHSISFILLFIPMSLYGFFDFIFNPEAHKHLEEWKKAVYIFFICLVLAIPLISKRLFDLFLSLIT